MSSITPPGPRCNDDADRPAALSKLPSHLRPVVARRCARSAYPSPASREGDDGLRFDNQEDIGPAEPKAERSPEQPVTGVQGWPRSLAFEDGELLAES